jgi:hypothetical protein
MRRSNSKLAKREPNELGLRRRDGRGRHCHAASTKNADLASYMGGKRVAAPRMQADGINKDAQRRDALISRGFKV